jgi:hypothetical protein
MAFARLCPIDATDTQHGNGTFFETSLAEHVLTQRFTRGVPVRPDELDAVMVRRLKSDLIRGAYRQSDPLRFARRLVPSFSARAVEKPAIRMLREDYWFRGVADNPVPLRVLTP